MWSSDIDQLLGSPANGVFSDKSSTENKSPTVGGNVIMEDPNTSPRTEESRGRETTTHGTDNSTIEREGDTARQSENFRTDGENAENTKCETERRAESSARNSMGVPKNQPMGNGIFP